MANFKPVSTDLQAVIESATKADARAALDICSKEEINTKFNEVSVAAGETIPPGESRFFQGVVHTNPTNSPLLPTSPQVITGNANVDFTEASVPTMADRPNPATKPNGYVIRTRSNGLQWRVIAGQYESEPITYNTYNVIAPTETVVGQRHHFPNGNTTLYTNSGPVDVSSIGQQGPQGEPGTTTIVGLNFPETVNNVAASSPVHTIDISTNHSHIFRITESTSIVASGWVQGASFTIDLINNTDTIHGLTWQGFDFISYLPTEIHNNSRFVFTGKCVLSEDGSEEFYQIALVGTGGSI